MTPQPLSSLRLLLKEAMPTQSPYRRSARIVRRATSVAHADVIVATAKVALIAAQRRIKTEKAVVIAAMVNPRLQRPLPVHRKCPRL